MPCALPGEPACYVDGDDVHHYDWSFLFAVIFILAGGLGNILVCMSIAWERRLQNVTNYFLLSLAVADLLVSLFVMPLGAMQGFLGEFHQLFYSHSAKGHYTTLTLGTLHSSIQYPYNSFTLADNRNESETK